MKMKINFFLISRRFFGRAKVSLPSQKFRRIFSLARWKPRLNKRALFNEKKSHFTFTFEGARFVPRQFITEANLNQMLKAPKKPTRLNEHISSTCGMRNEWMNHKLTTHYKRLAVEIPWKSLWFYIIKPINKPFDALLWMVRVRPSQQTARVRGRICCSPVYSSFQAGIGY
jgi:hypothetical protein